MMNKNAPVDRAPNPSELTQHPSEGRKPFPRALRKFYPLGLMASLRGWKTTAIAAAVASTVLGLASPNAWALSLGRMTVLSGLGEPLRAEIDLPDITAEEASSLKTEVAPVEAFRAAGLEYNSALADLRIVLQRRADGRALLRLSSNRAILDPFVDLILQANWATGRIVRDYTILLDPPSTRQAPAAVTAAPQVTSAAVANTPPASPPPAPALPSATTPRTMPTPASTPTPKPAAVDKRQVTVKTGDTASKIVSTSKPANVSLDQMLVALLRANPNAFINGNVNRVKTGAVLNLPDNVQAAATPAPEASQIIIAQSRDFNAFRGKLASSVPAVQVAGADRQASGKVQAEVDEKKTAPATPDKLTLSKGALKDKTSEDKIARDKADQEAAARVAELAKNITELNKLGASTAAAPASATKPPVDVPAVPVAVAAPAVASAPVAPAEPASAAASSPQAPEPAASAASDTAPPAAAPASAAASAPPIPTSEASSSWMDMLQDNPLVLAGAALVALLGGLGLYSTRRRKQQLAADSSFLESRMQPDSFFGASGGQRIDTHSDDAPVSSMSYSPSQLDAASDVDPIAEADVYLAYGRDLQAEEILKEAMRTYPDRAAIHAKLLEIYAKRRDIGSFAEMATQAHLLTKGEGPEWEHIAAMGRELEPNNTLFHATGPSSVKEAPAHPTWIEGQDDLDTEVSSPDTVQPTAQIPSGLDLDLDFLDQDIAPTAAAIDAHSDVSLTVPAPLELPHAEPESQFDGLDFDLNLSDIAAPQAEEPAHLASAAADIALPELELPAAEEAAASVEDMDAADPLATKLSLAEEFNSIGDEDGARALAEEVLAEATGALRAKAQAFLASLA